MEDNAENRALVRAVLEREGHVVLEAVDGLSGIEAAVREQPALILLDINLPGIDGYEVVSILKSFPSLAATAIVALTAYATAGDRQRTLVAGCDGFIQKPIDVETFPRQVAGFLAGQRERVDAREEGPYLRELNQRLVYRLLNQVEALKRLNQHFARRAVQLAELHRGVQEITSEASVPAMLEKLLAALSNALGTTSLAVELRDPPGLRIAVEGEAGEPRPAPLAAAIGAARPEWLDVEWSFPLVIGDRSLGVMVARHRVPQGARADEEQLLRIVANQVAIAVDNARLHEGVMRRAAEEESLVEAGRLLASTLDLSEVLARLAELARTQLTADLVRIWLPDPVTRELRLHAGAGALASPDDDHLRFALGEGVVGWIMEHRTSLVLPDFQDDPRLKYREDARAEGLVSFLGVPIMLGDVAEGVLVAGSGVRRVFAAEEVVLVEALARSAAVAIRNARLYEETQERLRHTETLLTVSQTAGSTLQLAEVARRTTREMVRALGADVGGAWVVDGPRLVPLAGYHVPKELSESLLKTPDEFLVPCLGRLHQTVYASHSHGDSRFDLPIIRSLPHKSVLLCPVRLKGEAIGGFVLLWLRESHGFTAQEIQLVEGIARQAAIAIENARLLEAERETKERLEVSETRYRELFENVMDAVYLHDLEGRILAVNTAGGRMTGYAVDELVGMNVGALMSAADFTRVGEAIRRLARGERMSELLTFELIRKNGTRVQLECGARVIVKNGVAVAVEGVARDVTARRKLERRQAAFAEIVKELAAEDDFDRLFSLIGRRACELADADSAVISLVEGDDIVLRGAYGTTEPNRITARRPVSASRVRRVLEERRPFVTPDVHRDPIWRESTLVKDLGYQALVEVPIILRGAAIGVLGALFRSPRAFGEEDVALLVSFAEHTAVALDRTNLLKKLAGRLQQTETLLAVSRAAGSTLDLTEVARRTVREIVRALGADMGGVWRRSPDRDELVPLAGYHVPRELLELFTETTLGGERQLIRAARALQGPFYTSDSRNDPRFDDPLLRVLPHKSLLAVPLSVKGEVVGGFAIVWSRETHRFSSEELSLVEAIAQQAAVAMENARLLDAEREAGDRLAASETRYRELFENVIDIVYLHDLEGRILAINEAGVRASGYTREELLTMNIGRFMAPAEAARSAALVRRMAAGERGLGLFTTDFRGKDGRRLILECSGRLLLKDGAPYAILGSARDITVRRTLEQRQETLVTLSRELATEVDLDRLLPRIAERARELMESDASILLLLEGDRLVFGGIAGLEEGLAAVGPLSVATSLTGKVIRERRALVSRDLAADPDWRATPVVRDFGYRAMLAVPITLKERTLGVLKLLHRAPRDFVEEEIRFLGALATQAALAIDNARLFSAQREEAEVSAQLLRLAEAVERVQDVDAVLDTVVRLAPQLLGLKRCGLFLFDPDEGTLAPAAEFGPPGPGHPMFRALKGLPTIPAVVRAIETQDPVIVQEGTPEFGIPAKVAAALNIRSLLLLPLVSRGRLMGTMAVHTPGELHTFTPKEIALARGIAAHAAVAIDNARLLKQTQTRLRETETLLTISRAVSSVLDPTEGMRRVARETARILGADTAGAYFADPPHEALHPIAGYHVPKTYESFRAPVPITGHRFVEEAWHKRQPVFASDAEADGRIDRGILERFPHRSVLFFPMLAKGEPIGGLFVLWATERHHFTAEELGLVEGIIHQASIFLENARLYSEATRRRREAEELARLARTLTESLDVADVGQRTVEHALQLLGSAFASLRLLEPDGSLKLLAASGQARRGFEPPSTIPLGLGVTGRAAAEGIPVWSSDVLGEPGASYPEELRRRIESSGSFAVLAVPMRVKRQIIGVLAIADQPSRVFSLDEVALLQTFADQAAIALENSRLYGELRAALRTVEESQQRIVQGERLRALGQMAGGVAHDFNNALAIIVGRAEVLLNETVDPELQQQLNIIIKVALDASQTVRRIQEFTRMRRSRPFQMVSLNQLVDEVVEVTRSRWKDEAHAKGIRYEVLVEARQTSPVAGDPSEIREALTNILFNAFDAMPEGGRVTLKTGMEGDRAFCAISDSGLGMTEEVKQRVFDPFFTTKGERGTGLGLSVVYGIVNRHGGEIDVQSQVGRGSVFTIRFPVGRSIGDTPPSPPPARSDRQGRILVVDDEKDVREVLMDLLVLDRHTVVMCADGEAALTRLREEPFDLVITDLGMPGISGWEVARHVKQSRPRTPVAMVTGWGDRIAEEEIQARGVDYIISKPFKRETIRTMVATALARAPEDPASAAGQREEVPNA